MMMQFLLSILLLLGLAFPAFAQGNSLTVSNVNNVNSHVNLVKYRYSTNRTIDGTTKTRILVLGDSVTVGAAATTTQQIYVARMAQLLNNEIPTVKNTIWWNYKTGGLTEPRVTVGSVWTVAGRFGHSLDAGKDTSPGTISFTPVEPCDTADIYWAGNGSGSGGLAAFDINVDGGSSLATVNTALNSYAVNKTTVTFTRGTHTINIVPVTPIAGNGISIVGIESIDSTLGQVMVSNIGVFAATASTFSTTGLQSVDNLVALYAPQLVLINLGVNDAGLSVDPATYASQIQIIINYCKAAGADVIICKEHPSGNGAAPLSFQIQYNAKIDFLGGTNGCNICDFFTPWGSYTKSIANYADGLHPNTIGHWDLGMTAKNAVTVGSKPR